MITTNTRHKIKVYTTPAYVEHFRLYLENKVVIKIIIYVSSALRILRSVRFFLSL